MADQESLAKYLTQVPQPLQAVIRDYIQNRANGFLREIRSKYNLTEENENDLTTEVLLVLCHVLPMADLKDEIIAEVGLSYETAVRIQRDLEKEIQKHIVPEAERRGFNFTEGQQEQSTSPVPTQPIQEDSRVLYQDSGCKVTRGLLNIGPTSYPMRAVTELSAPLHEPFELFGGFLLNAGLAFLGLMGILSFSPLWMVLGAIAALIGGSNVRSQFQRPWFTIVTFGNGEREILRRQNEADIRKLHAALRSALG